MSNALMDESSISSSVQPTRRDFLYIATATVGAIGAAALP